MRDGHEAVWAEAAVLHRVLVPYTAAAAVWVVCRCMVLLMEWVHVGVEVVPTVAVWGLAAVSLESVVHEVTVLHGTGTGAGNWYLAKGRVVLVLVATKVRVEARLEAATVRVNGLLRAAVWWRVVVVVAPASLLLVGVKLLGLRWLLRWTRWGVCKGAVGGLLAVDKVVLARV